MVIAAAMVVVVFNNSIACVSVRASPDQVPSERCWIRCSWQGISSTQGESPRNSALCFLSGGHLLAHMEPWAFVTVRKSIYYFWLR